MGDLLPLNFNLEKSWFECLEEVRKNPPTPKELEESRRSIYHALLVNQVERGRYHPR